MFDGEHALHALADSTETAPAPAVDLPGTVHATTRTVLVAMGTSYSASLEAASWFGELDREVVVAFASDFVEGTRGFSSEDLVLAVSDGGSSRETVRAAEIAHDAGALVIAVTGAENSPLGSLCRSVVRIGTGFDGDAPGAAQTAIVRTLASVARQLHGRRRSDDDASAAAALRALVPVWLEMARPSDPVPGSVDVLATARDAGTARQVALAFREIARVPAQSHDIWEYRHGWVESIDENQLLIVFLPSDEERARKIDEELRETGAAVLTIGPDFADVPVHVTGELRGTVAAAIPAALAYEVGARRGITAWDFRFTGVAIQTQLS